ncbi:MAG: polysaccharide pyruvyl transferase family protein [Elusimicrobiota bacterium]
MKPAPASPPRRRVPAVLAGYFGFGNAGDELILRSVLDRVRSVSWTVLAADPAKPAPGGASADGRWNPWTLARLFLRSKALVLGGGELFQTRTSVYSLFYYIGLILWARLWGCRVWAFGMGVDPALPGWARRLAAFALRGAGGVWFREEDGPRLLGVVGAAVVPDPVWRWPAGEARRPAALRRVLWILRPSGGASEADRWAARLNDLAARRAWEHGFLPMHPSEDLPFLGRLRAGLNFFHSLELWDDPAEIFSILERWDAAASMRFHGAAAAVLKGRPCAALAAHGKVESLARSLGLPVLSPDDWDARTPGGNPLEGVILKAWETEAPAEQIRRLREEAEAALAALDRGLASSGDGA